MYILRIETTDKKSRVALYSDEKILSDRFWVSKENLGNDLLPKIVILLRKNHIDLGDLDAISVDPGPGSFTGTRIGVATANALAWSLDLPVTDKLPMAKIAKHFTLPVKPRYPVSRWLVETS